MLPILNQEPYRFPTENMAIGLIPVIGGIYTAPRIVHLSMAPHPDFASSLDEKIREYHLLDAGRYLISAVLIIAGIALSIISGAGVYVMGAIGGFYLYHSILSVYKAETHEKFVWPENFPIPIG